MGFILGREDNKRKGLLGMIADEIRKELFSGCTSLRNVQLPSGVSTIGEWAFRSCSSLESIEIPENVTEIEAEAFLSCPCLVIITTPGSYAESFALKYGIPIKKGEKT